MLKIALCDDELQQRKLLKDILTPWLELQAIPYTYYEYDNGTALINHYGKVHYDLIFLDIEMPQLSGMDTAKRLREIDDYSIIIFITAYPDYVFQGYEVHAFHYILKPYQKQKIIDVTNGALSKLNDNLLDYLLIPQGSNSYRINLKETLFFSSDKRKLTVHLKNEPPIEYYGKLDELASKLPAYFCRIHQRYLINLHYIQVVLEHEVELESYTLPISRACKADFLIAFAQFMLKEG